MVFQADLPLTLRDAPDQTPGRRSFDNLVGAVRRCLDARLAPAHDDPFRLASLIWTAEHGLVLARISRPTFPWASIDALGDEMVTRMMRFHSTGSELLPSSVGQLSRSSRQLRRLPVRGT